MILDISSRLFALSLSDSRLIPIPSRLLRMELWAGLLVVRVWVDSRLCLRSDSPRDRLRSGANASCPNFHPLQGSRQSKVPKEAKGRIVPLSRFSNSFRIHQVSLCCKTHHKLKKLGKLKKCVSWESSGLEKFWVSSAKMTRPDHGGYIVDPIRVLQCFT